MIPHAVLLMGVAGSGKTTVGRALAQHLQWRFVDADDYHPAANVSKMRAGTPLVDADREPWLDRLNALMRHSAAKGESVVLACSALREPYRRRLSARLPSLALVHLNGRFDLIEQRLRAREHHYMPATLLHSQFEALEAPGEALVLDIEAGVSALVGSIIERLEDIPCVGERDAREGQSNHQK